MSPVYILDYEHSHALLPGLARPPGPAQSHLARAPLPAPALSPPPLRLLGVRTGPGPANPGAQQPPTPFPHPADLLGLPESNPQSGHQLPRSPAPGAGPVLPRPSASHRRADRRLLPGPPTLPAEPTSANPGTGRSPSPPKVSQGPVMVWPRSQSRRWQLGDDARHGQKPESFPPAARPKARLRFSHHEVRRLVLPLHRLPAHRRDRQLLLRRIGFVPPPVALSQTKRCPAGRPSLQRLRHPGL